MHADLQPLFDQLRKRLATHADLAAFDLVSLAQPSVRLATQRVPYARLELGESRIGGTPDVPANFDWPRWAPSAEANDRIGHPLRPDHPLPLGFMAQIDLSAISHVDDALPKTGWLYFFYDRYFEPWGFDPADRGCCRVIYADCVRSQLKRVQPPNDADEQHLAHPCLVETCLELTLPDEFQEVMDGTPAYNALQDVREDVRKTGESIYHRFLGYPQLIQNPMERDCQLASNGVYCGGSSRFQQAEIEALEAGTIDWRLLLQIDTDEDGPGWMWGDVGRIYFWIKQQDLATLRLDDVWLILQCS